MRVFDYASADLDAGRYTPQGFTGSNVTAVVPRISLWLRMAHLVLVFGEVDVTPTLAGGLTTRFRLSLPIISGFDDAVGVTGDFFSSAAGASGTIFANPGVQGTMQLAMKSKHTDSRRYFFQALYRIGTARVAVVSPQSPPLTEDDILLMRRRNGENV